MSTRINANNINDDKKIDEENLKHFMSKPVKNANCAKIKQVKTPKPLFMQVYPCAVRRPGGQPHAHPVQALQAYATTFHTGGGGLPL